VEMPRQSGWPENTNGALERLFHRSSGIIHASTLALDCRLAQVILASGDLCQPGCRV
jgi:hypothetical protein